MGVTRRGDIFKDGDNRITIARVSRKGLWADIRVEQPHGASWTKRQPLAFPKSFVPYFINGTRLS